MLNRSKKRIAIGVQGRFHAFDLAKALLDDGHDVWLYCTQPPFIVARCGFPANRVICNWWVGVLQRIFGKLSRCGIPYPIAFLSRAMGGWLARRLNHASFDVLHLWSEVAEECMQSCRAPMQLRIVVRGSTHIRYQQQILYEETARSGAPQEGPSEWVCEREEREYRMAHAVIVPSRFAKQSFMLQGVPENHVWQLTPGTPVEEFKPTPTAIDMRRQRYKTTQQPLRILIVSTVCYRKGLFDIERLIDKFSPNELEWRWVGPILPEAKDAVARLSHQIDFIGVKSRHVLSEEYAWGDLFLLPTIEDGFPQVLAQAAVSGLPIITTENGSGTDLVRPGVTGWVVPARDLDRMVEAICEALQSRELLAEMSQRLLGEFKPRNWHLVANDYQKLLDTWFESKIQKVYDQV